LEEKTNALENLFAAVRDDYEMKRLRSVVSASPPRAST
jgi:hypothetical protein